MEKLPQRLIFRCGLTCVLFQINSMGTSDDEGPAWNKFWLSMDNDESDSMVSGSHHPHRSVLSPDSHKPSFDPRDSVLPNESASHHGDEQSEFMESHSQIQPEEHAFPFKFKAPSGRVHRVNVLPSAGIAEMVAQVTAKLGPEVEAVGGAADCEDGKLSNTGYALSYVDNEGDTVSITTDQDLEDAVTLSHQTRRDKVDLFVHDPSQPPIPATVEPHPTPAPAVEEKGSPAVEAPAEETLLNHTRSHSFHSHPPEDQVIAGVPNELLLPGAIFTLAAVIAGVFILSRPTGR